MATEWVLYARALIGAITRRRNENNKKLSGITIIIIALIIIAVLIIAVLVILLVLILAIFLIFTNTNYIYPMPMNTHIGSGFGARDPIMFNGKETSSFHSGADFPAPEGTTIHAAQAGFVITAGWNDQAGNIVVIQHENGDVTRYYHCSVLLVQLGDEVLQGQPIAEVGSTGQFSSGNHLHFELYIKDAGTEMDPSEILNDWTEEQLEIWGYT
ncbi:MAG: M23 family metallopeptidase [Oscillospiraceae bacterium]|nr:M23 family metallopeptidase [Oscillospiraceae bacterium]